MAYKIMILYLNKVSLIYTHMEITNSCIYVDLSTCLKLGINIIILASNTTDIAPVIAVAMTGPKNSVLVPSNIMPIGLKPNAIMRILRTLPRIYSGAMSCTNVKLLVMNI